MLSLANVSGPTKACLFLLVTGTIVSICGRWQSGALAEQAMPPPPPAAPASPAAVEPPPVPMPQDPDLQDDPSLSKEERIRRHQLLVQKFVTAATAARQQAEKQEKEARQKTLEMQKMPPSAPPAPVAPPPAAPGAPGAAAPAAPAQTPFPLARSLVHLFPSEVLSRAGESFETEARLLNSSNLPFDQIVLSLKYDPLVATPETVNDGPIYRLVAGAPELTMNRSKGEMRYFARLREAIAPTSTALVRIRWRAINPVFYSEIAFVESKGATRIGKGDGNILGYVVGGEATGGTMSCGVIVAPQTGSRGQSVPSLPETMLARVDQRATVRLEADEERVAKGKEWIVSLMLRNNAVLPFNDLRVRALFDPGKLEVVDWHTGNWIRAGTNIYDGFAHSSYPFEIHFANSADNEKGEIAYHVGTVAAQHFPSGEFARIKFRALTDASLNDVWIDCEAPGRSGGVAETDVSFLGQSVMRPSLGVAEIRQRPAPEPLRQPER